MDQLYISENEELESEDDNTMQLVGFFIGKEHFGVNILMVQEIIKPAAITILPNSPDFIEGVINLRGSIIPVIELRKRLNLSERPQDQKKNIRILIVNVDHQVTGFIVDSVSKVIKIQKKTIEPPPDIITAGLASQYILGVCEIEKKLLIMLDFNKILQIKEIKKLREISID
ncbi:purine-binding chemotaxis protein CheW [Candidatus Magnetomoraceae bacterium gMMP-15]